MKPKRIIITRDADGDCSIWNRRLNPKKGLSDPGYYNAMTTDASSVHEFEDDYFRAIFGFLPSKGSKKVYEIREVTP